MDKATRNRYLKIGAAILAVIFVVELPTIIWYLRRARRLEVVIFDKTVPFQKYREHAAIPWLLEALKLRNAEGRDLDAARDFVGFDPVSRTGHDLTAENLERADVLVVSDTYGVYVGDYEKPGDVAALERSPRIYGGITANEATAIEAFDARGGLTIAEFNTFASPTDDPTRARLEKLFGVRWTKWVARYWPDLQDHNEVPRWVGTVYKRIYGHVFDLTGAGLVFVREDEDMVVLLAGDDLGADVISQIRTPSGVAQGIPERGGFWFWLDVLEAQGADVLAEHVIDVKPSGGYKLTTHGLPLRFPALVRNKNTWYFAGDYVDNTIELGDPRRVGRLGWKKRTSGCGGGSLDEGFFWGWYAPIMGPLLESRAHPLP